MQWELEIQKDEKVQVTWPRYDLTLLRGTPLFYQENLFFEHTYPLSNPVVNNWSVQYLNPLWWQPALRPFPQRHSSCCTLHSRVLHFPTLPLPPKWARSAPLRPAWVSLPPFCPGPDSLRSLKHNALFESKEEGTSVRTLPVCRWNV